MRRLSAGLAAVSACLLAPAVADAHGFYLTPEVAIPPWLLAVGAALIVAVSFVAIAALMPRTKLARSGWRPVAGGPFVAGLVELVAGAIGVLLLVLVIYAGLRGRQTFDQNFATVFVFITFWIGLAVVSAVLGDVYRLFNPWRAVGRAVGAVVGTRLVGSDTSAPEYPGWLGRLPAAAGLLVFGYLELQGGTTPRTVAIAALAYTGVTLAGMAIYGVERWIDRGETFAVYFNLFSRLAPVEARGDRLGVRRPLSGLATLEPARGTAVVLAAIIGVVSFDGFRSSPEWQDIQKAVVEGLEPAVGQAGAARVSTALGIVAMTCVIFGFYWLGAWAARRAAGGPPVSELVRAFAPALVPIALAYTLAHYTQYLTFQGQRILGVASDPLGDGSNLIGLVDFQPKVLLPATTAWYLEVAFVVLGHVAATLVAHDRALAIYSDVRSAARSQRWMVLIMIGFSVFALWLLSQATELSFTG